MEADLRLEKTMTKWPLKSHPKLQEHRGHEQV